MAYNIKLLDTAQTYEFDTEYINSTLFKLVESQVNLQPFSQRDFNMLDVGGGNGKYVDRFLDNFTNAHCTIVEPETYLINKNTQHPRKLLINNTFQGLTKQASYHTIQFNWVLHHFISSSYRTSCRVQLDGIKEAYSLLKPGGIILIFENFYESPVLTELSSWLIYQLTASTTLKQFTSKMGANTAGVGVCFHSEQYWVKQLKQAGFKKINTYHCYDFGNLSSIKKNLLMIDKQRVGLISAIKP